jgi:predicted O-methyltransferase YrrM
MSQNLWTSVDAYLTDVLVPSDPVLKAALRDSDGAGLPPINVAPNQGKLLQLLAHIHGAKTILEIGTLGGYSTIWLARALPKDGKLITLELDPNHAKVAKRNIARADLSHIVDIRVGKAIETLSLLEKENVAPFDFIFIDADKPSNPEYLAWALKLARVGTVIIVDNVVRGGAVIDAASDDPNVIGVRSFFELLSAEPRISATALQTVGSKGYDGFVLAIVKS